MDNFKPGEYHKLIPIISPGLIFVQRVFFVGLIFGGTDFRRVLPLLEGILNAF